MNLRNCLIILVFFLLGLGTLGCSGGSDLGGLSPTVNDDEKIVSGQTTGTGNVLSSLEGVSVPYAEVYVDGELTTFTDENGEYVLDLSPGEHTIAFGIDDFIFHETSVDPNTREVMQFPHPPEVGSVGGKVFGRPLNSENGEFVPVENAIVLVIDRDSRWFGADITDEEGKYLVKHAPAGASTIAVFARGYLPWATPIFINPDTLQIRNVYLRRAPNLGLLLGLVRDPDFEPIADAHVILTDPDDPEFERHALTKECGVFLINKIIPGEYGLHVEKEGYDTVDRPVLIKRGRNFVRIKLFPTDDGGGDG